MLIKKCWPKIVKKLVNCLDVGLKFQCMTYPIEKGPLRKNETIINYKNETICSIKLKEKMSLMITTT